MLRAEQTAVLLIFNRSSPSWNPQRFPPNLHEAFCLLADRTACYFLTRSGFWLRLGSARLLKRKRGLWLFPLGDITSGSAAQIAIANCFLFVERGGVFSWRRAGDRFVSRSWSGSQNRSRTAHVGLCVQIPAEQISLKMLTGDFFF